jgi:hypothetical protein
VRAFVQWLVAEAARDAGLSIGHGPSEAGSRVWLALRQVTPKRVPIPPIPASIIG